MNDRFPITKRRLPFNEKVFDGSGLVDPEFATTSVPGDVQLTTRLKLKPGQKGTKKLHAEHGDALVCVRYRYDEKSCTRTKTVELVVEKTAWRPPVRKFGDNDLVPVRIGFAEKELIASAKAAKGRWNPEVKLWYIRYGKIKGTVLEKHIILDASPCR